MFLPDTDKRDWFTAGEMSDSNVREKYDNNDLAGKYVYLMDPYGGRGHYVDVEVFYRYHLPVTDVSNLPIEFVVYEEGDHTNLLSGYYDSPDVQGYAGPIQNLQKSGNSYSGDDLVSEYTNNSNIMQNTSSQYLSATTGRVSTLNYEQFFTNEFNNEMSQLFGEDEAFKPEDRTLELYQEDPQGVINALDLLRIGK